MSKSPRSLYSDNLNAFLEREDKSIFGVLCDAYHGDALTTSREAWLSEIQILQNALLPWNDSDAHIIFEYDIPRLGKRIDVVLLLKGIIFCLEFKVNEGIYDPVSCSCDFVVAPEFYESMHATSTGDKTMRLVFSKVDGIIQFEQTVVGSEGEPTIAYKV